MEIAKSAAAADDDDVITLAQWSKSPPAKKPRPIKPSSSSSSSAKTKNSKEKEEKISNASVKKRNSDVQIKFVVSGRSGSPLSSKPSIVAIDGSCVSGQAKSSALIRAQEVRSNLEPEFPSFVKSLVRSHVASCFWMGLPGQFCKSHLPDKDTTITVEDENEKQYGIKYIAYKTGLSAGWRQFAVAHQLLEGDVLVFQLIKPTKFKVYIIRANDLTEVDGALGLLNLDCHTKQNDADIDVPSMTLDVNTRKDNAQMDAVASCDSMSKRPKSLPLSIVQKKKRKAGLPRPVPKPVEQSENDSDEVASEVLEGSKLSGAATQFHDVKSFENFSIQVDGLLLDSEPPRKQGKTYYKLCCSQNAFLHENVIKGMNKKLIVGTISETVHIANAIKACKLTTSRDDLAAWDKSLKAFELLGMNVGFLHARLSQLTGLAYESKVPVDARGYAASRRERALVKTGMKDIETKLAELKEAFENFDATVQSLSSQTESYEHKFHQEARW